MNRKGAHRVPVYKHHLLPLNSHSLLSKPCLHLLYRIREPELIHNIIWFMFKFSPEIFCLSTIMSGPQKLASSEDRSENIDFFERCAS